MRYLPVKLDNGDILVVIESPIMTIPALNFHSMDDFHQWLLESLEWCGMDKNSEWLLRKAHEQSLIKDIPDAFKEAFDGDKSP